MKAKSGLALVLVASWDTSVPWLEMTVNVAINPRNLLHHSTRGALWMSRLTRSYERA